jgi:vacuolar iron transporter family protein
MKTFKAVSPSLTDATILSSVHSRFVTLRGSFISCRFRSKTPDNPPPSHWLFWKKGNEDLVPSVKLQKQFPPFFPPHIPHHIVLAVSIPMYQSDFPEIMVPVSLETGRRPASRGENRAYRLPTMSFTSFKNFFNSRRAALSEKEPSWFGAKPDDVSYKKISDLESTGSDRDSSDGSSMTESTNSTKQLFKSDARVVSDAIIGLSDGLTVPFALTAGLSALGNTQVVIYGGMAELIAGAISMGLGGYLGAKSEEYVPSCKVSLVPPLTSCRDSYHATVSQTRDQLATSPASVSCDIASIFEPYNLPSSTTQELIQHLSDSPKLLDFLMHFQHTLPKPASSRAMTCALTIALGYFIGGLVPLLPYFFVAKTHVTVALCWSIGIMITALFVFGYVKTCFVAGWRGRANVLHGVVGAAQMVVVGSAAAGAAMGVVKAFKSFAEA